MPIHEYKCKDCNSKYEIFHRTKEDDSKIICPECESKNYKKLLSGFSASVKNANDNCETGSCGMPNVGGCSGGMCGLN